MTHGERNGAGVRGLSPSSAWLADLLTQLPAQFRAQPAKRGLIVTSDSAADTTFPAVSGWAVYRLPSAVVPSARSVGARAAADEGGLLPFAEGAFDAICIYAAILPIIQHAGLLNKVLRMLRPNGVVVVVEPLESFNFTTFPIGGPAHLLRRRLLEAGFRGVQALPGSDRVLIFAAERGPAPG